MFSHCICLRQKSKILLPWKYWIEPCENHEKKIILRGLGQFLRNVGKNLVDNFSLPNEN